MVVKKWIKNINKIIKEILLDLKIETLDIIKNTKKEIFINKNNTKEFIIFIFILYITFLTISLVFFVSIFFYTNYLIKIIIRVVRTKLRRTSEKINIEKSWISINNNVYAIFIKKIIFEQSKMKSFLIIYYQISLIKEVKKKEKEIILIIIKKVIFRLLFLFTTGIPLIVVKNAIFIKSLINEIFRFKKTPLNIKIKTLMYNIIIKYNSSLTIQTKKNKIILFKGKIKLNMKENEFEILKQLVDIELWVQGTNILTNKGIFTQMRYFTYNNINIPYHPTIYFRNKFNNELLVINQTTKQNLKVLDEYKKSWEEKTKNDWIYENKNIKLKLEMKKIFSKGEGYLTIPHTVDEENVILGDPTRLILNLDKKENELAKFKFIQSFFAYMDYKLYKINPNKGLVQDKNYNSIKEYLINNIDNFDEDIKIGLEKILEFYDKNENNLKIIDNNFLNLLSKAEVNLEIKSKILQIIEKYSK